MTFEVVGDEKVAAEFRQAAVTVDLRMRGDMENVVERIAGDYRDGVARRSGRTAAGVGHEVRQTPMGLEGEVYNTHFVAGFHEYGGARSAPNPALKRATDAHAPSWVEQVARKAGDI